MKSIQTPVSQQVNERLGRKVRVNVSRNIKERLSGIETLVVFKTERVSTSDLNQLRRQLQGLQSNLVVVKNSLGRLAFAELGWDKLTAHLATGTCGVAEIGGELATVAKLLTQFCKEHEGFVLQGGYLKGSPLSPQDITALSHLPSREVLLSQLAGLAIGPLRHLVVVLQGNIRTLAVLLQATAQKKAKAS